MKLTKQCVTDIANELHIIGDEDLLQIFAQRIADKARKLPPTPFPIHTPQDNKDLGFRDTAGNIVMMGGYYRTRDGEKIRLEGFHAEDGAYFLGCIYENGDSTDRFVGTDCSSLTPITKEEAETADPNEFYAVIFDGRRLSKIPVIRDCGQMLIKLEHISISISKRQAAEFFDMVDKAQMGQCTIGNESLYIESTGVPTIGMPVRLICNPEGWHLDWWNFSTHERELVPLKTITKML